jgi:hypothetical protein
MRYQSRPCRLDLRTDRVFRLSRRGWGSPYWSPYRRRRSVPRRRPEDRVEPGHRRRREGRQGVAIPVEGDRDLLVAVHLADDLRVRPSRQLEGRESVPQVVEADRRQAGPPEQCLELASD